MLLESIGLDNAWALRQDAGEERQAPARSLQQSVRGGYTGRLMSVWTSAWVSARL